MEEHLTKPHETTQETYDEKRCWVRLTRVCNNNCVFCLDQEMQDGSFIPLEEVVRELNNGVQSGAERSILSGGEPTLHPHFLKIVAKAREVGYKKIQVITNGRRFAYPDFLVEAINEGVDEITFSMHGHTRELHDAQTGAKGSFAQAVKGLFQALKSGKVIVNVDIVLNRYNYRYLPEIITYFHRLGVNEFDLLQVVPFGRAWEKKEAVICLPEEVQPYLQKAILFAEKRGIRLWTNRFPPQYLEGFENYVQNPSKIRDEVRGRQEMFQNYLDHGTLPLCYGERCCFCFVQEFCRVLIELRQKLSKKSIAGILVSPKSLGKLHLIEKLSLRDIVLHRVSASNYEKIAMFEGRKKLWLENEEEWNDWQGVEKMEYEIVLGEGGANLLLKGILFSRNSNISLTLPFYEEHDNFSKESVSLRSFFECLTTKGIQMPKVKNIPPCLYDGEAFYSDDVYDLRIFNEDLSIDLDAFTTYFLQHKYRVKSLRCKPCKFFSSCEGLPIQYVRRFGFFEMEPVPENVSNTLNSFKIVPLERLLVCLKEHLARKGILYKGWKIAEIYPWGDRFVALRFTHHTTEQAIIIRIGAPDDSSEALLSTQNFNLFYTSIQGEKAYRYEGFSRIELLQHVAACLDELALLPSLLKSYVRYSKASKISSAQEPGPISYRPAEKGKIQKSCKLWISSPCTFNCAFCSLRDLGEIGNIERDDFDFLKQEMERGRTNGARHLFVTGFEILNYERILDVLEYAKKIGYEAFEVHTTGIKFDDAVFTKRFLDLLGNRRTINLPLYGHTASLHDKVTGIPGSFQQLLNSIRCLIANGASKHLRIATVLIKQNYRYVSSILTFCRELNLESFSCRLPYPVTDSIKDRYASVAVRFTDILTHLLACKPFVPLDIVYPCVLLKYLLETPAGSIPKDYIHDSFLSTLLSEKEKDSIPAYLKLERLNFAQYHRVCLVTCPYLESCLASPYCVQRMFRKYIVLFGEDEFCCVTQEMIDKAKRKVSADGII